MVAGKLKLLTGSWLKASVPCHGGLTSGLHHMTATSHRAGDLREGGGEGDGEWEPGRLEFGSDLLCHFYCIQVVKGEQ